MNYPSIQAEAEALFSQPNVRHLSEKQARTEAERFGAKTQFGNYAYHTTVKNRSAAVTVYVGPDYVQTGHLTDKRKALLQKLPKTLEAVKHYLKIAPFVCVERGIGDNAVFSPQCRTYISVARPEMVRLAHMWTSLLFAPNPKANGPRQTLIYIPEWQEKDRQILVFPEENLNLVLGSDYLGEAKKGHLRLAMWNAKKEKMLGVHAGAKLITAQDAKEGKLKRYGMLLFGLTATGKTTHSCHDHGLDGKGEGILVVQDDVVFMRQDGSALGTERGFFLKTGGLNPVDQRLLYQAAASKNALLENTLFDYQGKIDFDDEVLTGNGRGVVQWADFGKAKAPTPNLPPVAELDGLIIAFITRRNTVVPLCSKLTVEQGAAAFMLGESIESTGGDPKKAGESVRVVGTNPFIIGCEADEGNRFYELLKSCGDKAQCYLLNTGGVGEIMEKKPDGTKVVRQKVRRVQIPEMSTLIRGIVRNSIEWQEDPLFSTQIPKAVDGLDMSQFALEKFYPKEQIEQMAKTLTEERVAYLEKYPTLNPQIRNTIKTPSACSSA